MLKALSWVPHVVKLLSSSSTSFKGLKWHVVLMAPFVSALGSSSPGQLAEQVRAAELPAFKPDAFKSDACLATSCSGLTP